MPTPTLGPLNALAQAVANQRKLMYDAYVDLKGVDLPVAKLIATGTARRDVFGDLQYDTPNGQVTTSTVRLVVNFGEIIKLLDTADNISAASNLAADTGPDTTYEMMAKLEANINIGDVIQIPYSLVSPNPAFADQLLEFQVKEVRVGSHMFPYTKRVVTFNRQ
jgi:hypothetical protein